MLIKFLFVPATDGYTKRFGIVYVDYKHGLLRHLKASAKFLAALFGPEPLAAARAAAAIQSATVD